MLRPYASWQSGTGESDMGQNIGFSTKLNLDYERAVQAARAALQEEGFGVLTEIDVKTTVKQKLDKDFRRYVILGACNPPLAHRALEADPSVGLLLPCNVIVYEEGNGSVVAAVDPLRLLGVLDNPALKEVAQEAEAKLRRAIDKLGVG
jgi:uncharacterized protein (DUF302 family)